MKLVFRYIIREVSTHAALGLMLFTFVIFMRDMGRLLEVVVRSNSAFPLAAFLYAIPPALVFTIPMAVLVGLLIGLGRLAGDNEITALRAAGVNVRQLLRPLLAFVLAGMSVAVVMALWVAPRATQALFDMENGLRGSQAAFEVQPRVFLESIPDLVVYIEDTLGGGKAWRKVFVADMRDPASPRITMAERGELVNYGEERLQLHLENGISYDTSAQRPDTLLTSSFLSTDIPLRLPPARAVNASLAALSTGQVWWRSRFAADWRAARVELHRRIAIAFACLTLALVGIPLGLNTRKGGKSGGFVITLLLVLAYYVVFITGIAMARQGYLAPWLGVWLANLVCLGAGVWLVSRADRIPKSLSGGIDPVAMLRNAVAGWLKGRRGRAITVSTSPWAPTLIDAYVLREFIGYVALVLASFLMLILVFTFFELLGDIVRTRVGLHMLLKYLLYLSPQLLYQTVPVAILVGVLVTFGLMSKANEVTALKACGVSIYRLIIPVVLLATALCAFQFALDESYLPRFNRKQEALRSQIKGRPAQTYSRPGRKWLFGEHNDLFYFQAFDPYRNEFGNISVFDFNPQTFQLTHSVFARAAHWDPHVNGWVFEEGWTRTLSGVNATRFERFGVATFPQIAEAPAYFKTEARESSQMGYGELLKYITDLQHSGYSVSRLRVQLEKKLAYPIITVVMGLLAFPFSLSVGRRGAVTGIAVAIGVAILYWVTSGLMEAMGNLGQLPPSLAAWVPDVMFTVAGVYLLLKVPS